MKDTFFFSHDYNARSDPKMQKVLMKHGCTGIGVYWCIVEQIYEQGGALPLEDCESIAFALHVDCKVVESIMNDFDLFKNDGENFWSESVNERLNKRAEISQRRRDAINKRWSSTNDPKTASNEIQDKYNSNTNVSNSDTNNVQCNTIKVKESKEKNNKEKNNKEDNNESNKLDSTENELSGASDSLNNQSDSYSGEPKPKEKSSAKKEKVFPPTLRQVADYCSERKNNVNPQKFIDHYTARGWKYNGGIAMKDWKAAIRTWEQNNFDNGQSSGRIGQSLPPADEAEKNKLLAKIGG